MFARRSRPHHHSSWLYGRPLQGSPSVSHGRRCPRSDVPFPTSPSDISAVAAPATRWVPLSSHPLPRFDKRSSSSVRALPSGRVLLHGHQQYRLTRSDSLTPTLPFPTHGCRKCLFGGISPTGLRGSLQLRCCRSHHHVAADTPPVRAAASDSFRRPLLPSRVIDRLGHRIENVERGYVCVHCTLQPDASRTLLSSMLSEGSAVLLSRHGASLASKPESFGFGRTFTDMTACPVPGHADPPALGILGQQALGLYVFETGTKTPGSLHVLGLYANNGTDGITIRRHRTAS